MEELRHDHPVVESLDKTGLPPWDSGEEPHCPVCGAACDTVYFDRLNDAVGCENCLTARDAWDLMYEQ